MKIAAQTADVEDIICKVLLRRSSCNMYFWSWCSKSAKRP